MKLLLKAFNKLTGKSPTSPKPEKVWQIYDVATPSGYRRESLFLLFLIFESRVAASITFLCSPYLRFESLLCNLPATSPRGHLTTCSCQVRRCVASFSALEMDARTASWAIGLVCFMVCGYRWALVSRDTLQYQDTVCIYEIDERDRIPPLAGSVFQRVDDGITAPHAMCPALQPHTTLGLCIKYEKAVFYTPSSICGLGCSKFETSTKYIVLLADSKGAEHCEHRALHPMMARRAHTYSNAAARMPPLESLYRRYSATKPFPYVARG